MKICFCIDTMESGGAERVASMLCNEFVELGHEVDLIMISAQKKISFYDLDKKINLIPLLSCCKKKNSSFLNKVFLLKKHFKNNHYEVVISFLPNVNFCVFLSLKRFNGTIHIASERNNPYQDPQSKIRRFFKELAFKNADGIVFQTEDAKNYFNNKIKCPVQVIKNPVLPVINNIDLEAKTNGNIISVGRLEEQKNFPLLINAFFQFNKLYPSSRLKIFGEGSLKDKLAELVDSLNLSNIVQLCGNSKTWIEDNYNCSLFINSSFYEGMPNSLLEALINGMPCIASDCPIGGSRELLSYRNGLLFNNDNQQDLINKMCFLYNNDTLVAEYRRANFKMRDYYSSQTISKQWIEFIERIIHETK